MDIRPYDRRPLTRLVDALHERGDILELTSPEVAAPSPLKPLPRVLISM